MYEFHHSYFVFFVIWGLLYFIYFYILYILYVVIFFNFYIFGKSGGWGAWYISRFWGSVGWCCTLLEPVIAQAPPQASAVQPAAVSEWEFHRMPISSNDYFIEWLIRMPASSAKKTRYKYSISYIYIIYIYIYNILENILWYSLAKTSKCY